MGDDTSTASDGKLPLGLFKQVYMKLDSAMSDIYEIREDPDLSVEDRDTCEKMTDVLGTSLAHITNIVAKEIDEDTFVNENVKMDDIDPFPEVDIMSTEIE